MLRGIVNDAVLDVVGGGALFVLVFWIAPACLANWFRND